MRIDELLNVALTEGIEVNGNEFVAYCIVVAEQYVDMPKVDPKALVLWNDVIEHNEKMLMKILKSVNIEYTSNDPYKNQNEMMYDIIVNNRLQIFKTPSDDAHPGMTAFENDIFRTVHDFIGHHLPNTKEFSKFLAKNNNKQNDEFRNFRFKRNNFTVRGEINTYISHGKLLPEKLRPVLFTEIIGQICTYFITNNFTENKVGIMNGIDFKKIGLFTDSNLEKRKMYYIEKLNDSGVNSFKTRLGKFDKDNIRWNLLSRGEGQVRKSN